MSALGSGGWSAPPAGLTSPASWRLPIILRQPAAPSWGVGAPIPVASQCHTHPHVHPSSLCRRQIVRLELEPHLNTCFRHFVLFTREFQLIDDRELAPMKELIDKMVR